MIDGPHLEDIYDMSTAELQELQQILRRKPTQNQNLLDTVLIELQERKTLNFFTEFCQIENPYAKKVTDYNNEFLKLAEEAIKQNKSASEQKQKKKQLSGKEKSEEKDNKFKSDYFKKTQKNATTIGNTQTDNQSRTHQSQIAHRIDNISMKSNSRDSQRTDNFSQLSVDKKMNIGASTKKKKNKMKQMMANMLAKTKVSGGVTIGKAAGSSPIKPQNQRKYHIPGEKHENLELRQSKKDLPKAEIKVEKKSNRGNHEELIRKKNQISQKMKGSKRTSVKLPKVQNSNNKMFVQMMRKEEEQRKVKTQKLIRQKQNVSLPMLSQTKKEQEQVVEQIQCNYESEKIKNQDQIIEDIVRQEDIIAEEEIEESLSDRKLQEVMKKQNQFSQQKEDFKEQKIQQIHISKNQNRNMVTSEKSEKNFLKGEKEIYIEEKQQRKRKEKSQIKQDKIVKVQEIKKDQKINNFTQQNSPNKVIVEKKEEIDYAAKLIKEIEEQQDGKFYFFNQKPQNIGEQNEQMNENKEVVQHHEMQHHQKVEEDKNCYNEEYWLNVREQAQQKIKRFRQQKQLEEIQKQKLTKRSSQLISTDKNNEHQEVVEESIHNIDFEDEPPEQFRQKKKSKHEQEISNELKERHQQFKKVKNMVMKKTGMKKKAEAKPPAPPKFIRPKPQFNYLQVYPTFNHIFSVMYLKPVSQAISDIPNIIRELRILFSTHVDHFKQKSNFQPALFLPFDNNYRFSDPKQLIMNAQNTYIDLKVMMERTQTFNANLHGQFTSNDNRYYRVIKTREQVYDIVTTSFLRREGWKELAHGCGLKASWNLFWSWSRPDIDLNKLLIWQRINHFPFNKNLSRKDLLYKNLEHFKKSYRVSMNFLPLTFNLPKDFTQFSIKFHEEEIVNKDNNYWIMKPIGKSRGRGIKVIGALSELNYIDNIVVQKYISDPLLLDGYKFDMRIYVLVTSFHPLQAFVYREGFARLSTQKYSLDPQSIKNAFMHLTNFSINKNNVEAKENFSGGSKISLKTLKERLTKMNYSFSNIWNQVHEIIVKSLLGCSISVPPFPTAFQLFGYDIMIDKKEQCHLIQINSSPSLERSYLIDQIVKQSLIDDIFDIVDPPNFDKNQFLDVASERLTMMENKKKISPEQDLIALARLLKYKPIRKLGQKPQKMGLFEMVAPSESSRQLQKLIKSKSYTNNPLNID